MLRRGAAGWVADDDDDFDGGACARPPAPGVGSSPLDTPLCVLADGANLLLSDAHSTLAEPHDTSIALPPPPTPQRSRRCRDPARPRRKYDIAKALATRRRNELLRREGKQPPPPYIPRRGLENKRKYDRSGQYRGATLHRGGQLRAFSAKTAAFYAQAPSRFVVSKGGGAMPPPSMQEFLVTEVMEV